MSNFSNPLVDILKCSTLGNHFIVKTIPCANACSIRGIKACGACALVSYCSQECQKAHWHAHKNDCKNPMRSKNWAPAWIVEGRSPLFSNDPVVMMRNMLSPGFREMMMEDFAAPLGTSLWGNTPEVDLINLQNNENDLQRDYSLACVASGDLRHIVRTINALPSNYSGKLNILINDIDLNVVCRNVLLLLILGTMPDEALAVDLALHLWHSFFMPFEYRLHLSGVLSLFCKSRFGESAIALGSLSTMSCLIPIEEAKLQLLHYNSRSEAMSPESTKREYDRVKTLSSRRDITDKMYAILRPSHRVAFQKFRRYGVVLPFGVAHANFDKPNPSLFSPEGKLMQADLANPLNAWDLDAVMKVGKAHGAHAADIYGCLYFFLTQELRSFRQRLSKFRISFKLCCTDACRLASTIQTGILDEEGLSSSIRFDRIDVSNILDTVYVGMQDVLIHWAPLLADSSSATLVGYFMNWHTLQSDGVPSGASAKVVRKLSTKFSQRCKSSSGVHETELDLASILDPDDMTVLYENSKPFMKYLGKQGLADILNKTKLRLKETHTIVPHRIKAPLGGKLDALPELSDESWYYYIQVTSLTWAERFVEFVHK